MLKNKVKDKKINIFREIEINDATIKQYIHPYKTKLYAYVRQLSANEQATANALQDRSEIEFIVNKRKIEIDMFIEFADKTYQISAVDNFEFYMQDLKLRAYEVNKKEYDEVRWYEII